jgi:hypothetical protein
MMAVRDVTLTKTEKNAVFNWLEAAKFDPADFEWSETQHEEATHRGSFSFKASTITHRHSGYWFGFGGIYCSFVPGLRMRNEVEEHLNDWSTKAASFHLWLHRLRQEVDAPDLWATIGQEKVLSTAASSANLDNRPFAAAEQTLIAAKLDEIKAYLLQGQQFAAEEAETVEQEFTYLRESSERLGKKDWLNNLLGGLVGLAIGLALDPEKARGLLRLAGALFQSLWGMGHNLLP